MEPRPGRYGGTLTADNKPAFRLGEIKIPIPARTGHAPTTRLDQQFLNTVIHGWHDFCKMALEDISKLPPSSVLNLASLSSEEKLNEPLILPKETIRKDVLKTPAGQKVVGPVYSYFKLGEVIPDSPIHSPEIRITRLELFQLLALVHARAFCVDKWRKQRRDRQSFNPKRKPDNNRYRYKRLMEELPEHGGPLMNA